LAWTSCRTSGWSSGPGCLRLPWLRSSAILCWWIGCQTACPSVAQRWQSPVGLDLGCVEAKLLCQKTMELLSWERSVWSWLYDSLPHPAAITSGYHRSSWPRGTLVQWGTSQTLQVWASHYCPGRLDCNVTWFVPLGVKGKNCSSNFTHFYCCSVKMWCQINLKMLLFYSMLSCDWLKSANQIFWHTVLPEKVGNLKCCNLDGSPCIYFSP